MTGSDVKALREDLGWTGGQFANLFGVHPSTIYRWEEQADTSLKIEPLQLQLLTVMLAEMRKSPRHGVRLRDQLENAIALGGSLRAIHVLLAHVFAAADGAGSPVSVEKQ